jgi:hypothetical protein
MYTRPNITLQSSRQLHSCEKKIGKQLSDTDFFPDGPTSLPIITNLNWNIGMVLSMK